MDWVKGNYMTEQHLKVLYTGHGRGTGIHVIPDVNMTQQFHSGLFLMYKFSSKYLSQITCRLPSSNLLT